MVNKSNQFFSNVNNQVANLPETNEVKTSLVQKVVQKIRTWLDHRFPWRWSSVAIEVSPHPNTVASIEAEVEGALKPLLSTAGKLSRAALAVIGTDDRAYQLVHSHEDRNDLTDRGLSKKALNPTTEHKNVYKELQNIKNYHKLLPAEIERHALNVIARYIDQNKALVKDQRVFQFVNDYLGQGEIVSVSRDELQAIVDKAFDPFPEKGVVLLAGQWTFNLDKLTSREAKILTAYFHPSKNNCLIEESD